MTTCQKCNGFVGFVDGPHELKPCLCDFKSLNKIHPMNTTTQCKHTPGPWKHWTNDMGHMACGPDGKTPIAKILVAGSVPTMRDAANLRLIAAAPELLEACKEALAYVNSQPDAPSGSVASVGQCGLRHILKHAVYHATGYTGVTT